MRDSIFSALVFSLSWAVYLTFSKAVLSAGAGPFAFGILATFIAAFFLLTSGILLKKVRIADAGSARRIVLVAALYDLSIFTGFYGLGASTLINYAFLIKTTVVFTVFLSAVFLKESLSSRKIFLAVTLLAGAYLLSTKGQSLVPMAGDLWIVFTALVLSVGNVLSKPLLRSVDAFNFAFLRVISGAAMFLPIAFFIDPSPSSISLTPAVAGAGFFLALTAFLLYRTMRMTSVSYMSMFSTLTPVFASVLAFLALGETMNSVQVLGGALILLAVFLLPEER